MSEERFDRLESKVDRLETRFDGLETRFDGLESRFDGLKTRFDGLETRMGGLEVKVNGLGSEMKDLRTEMRTLHEATNHRMLVLHEEVLDRIAALAPDFTPIRREFRQADDKLREDIDRRLVPLEAAVRLGRRRKN